MSLDIAKCPLGGGGEGGGKIAPSWEPVELIF